MCRVLSRAVRQDVESQAFYWLDLELSPLPGLSCSSQVSVISTGDSGTLGPAAGPPVSYSFPSPVQTPSVILGFFVSAEDGTDIGELITLTPPWTYIDGYSPGAPDRGRHTNMAIGALPWTSGTPAAMQVNWTYQPEVIGYRFLGFSVNTAAVAPVQIASQLVTGGTVTLGSPPTPGNILVLMCVYEDAGDNAPDINLLLGSDGWMQLKSVNLAPVSAQHAAMAVGVKCIPAGMSSVIATGNPGYSHWAFVQEWAFT